MKSIFKGLKIILKGIIGYFIAFFVLYTTFWCIEFFVFYLVGSIAAFVALNFSLIREITSPLYNHTIWMHGIISSISLIIAFTGIGMFLDKK